MADYILHKGVKGMHWGVRKDGGPQGYPGEWTGGRGRKKGSSDKAVESTKKTVKGAKSKNLAGLSEEAVGILSSIAIAIGLNVAVTTHAYSKERKMNEKRAKREHVKQFESSENFDHLMEHKSESNSFKAGLSTNEIKSQHGDMIKHINEKAKGRPGGMTNCVNCSAAYIVNRLYGTNVAAQPWLSSGRNPNIVIESNMLKGTKSKVISNGYVRPSLKKVNRVMSKKPNAVGQMSLTSSYGTGHSVAYETDARGNVTIIDPQINKIMTLDQAYQFYGNRRLFMTDIIDCTNATLRPKDKLISNIVHGDLL